MFGNSLEGFTDSDTVVLKAMVYITVKENTTGSAREKKHWENSGGTLHRIWKVSLSEMPHRMCSFLQQLN